MDDCTQIGHGTNGEIEGLDIIHGWFLVRDLEHEEALLEKLNL
jgi:hypothetical protein